MILEDKNIKRGGEHEIMNYFINEQLCQKLHIKIQDVTAERTGNEIRIHGHLTSSIFPDTEIFTNFGIAIDFLDPLGNVYFTSQANWHGDFSKTHYTTFFVRMSNINERLPVDKISQIQIYPFIK